MKAGLLNEAKARLQIPELWAMLGLPGEPGVSRPSPFREDKKASFSVFDDGTRWKDFATGEGGDAVDLLAKARSLSNGDACREFLKLAGVGQPESAQPGFKWAVCVAALTLVHRRKLAKWRGYTSEFCEWLHAEKYVGLVDGECIAFPVHDAGGNIVGCHFRLKEDGSWRYMPKGTKARPLVIGDPFTATRIFAFESQWDAFAVLDRLAWHATGGLPDTAVFITRGASNARLAAGKFQSGAVVFAFQQNDAPGQKWLADLANAAGCEVRRVATPEPRKDLNDWTRAGATREDIETAMTTAEAVQSPRHADDVDQLLSDPRPKIRLPGPDRLLSEYATELATALRDREIYNRNGEVVVLCDGDLTPVSPQTFRSLAERYFIGYRSTKTGGCVLDFKVTMAESEARGTLASPQFTERLRRVLRVNRARLPVRTPDGGLTLLPNGYDATTQTLTLANFDFATDMPLADAVKLLTDLLSEFCFTDGERSRAVAIAAMVGLFANQLLPAKSLRPCFIFLANAEGAGKTLLVTICVTPALGEQPTGSKAKDDDEMRKAILTVVREGRQVLFLDNIKGRLSSEPLEAFLTAPVWSGRKLGVSETVTGENQATVFVTGNGCTESPDMRRRSLFVELHLEVERAEDRQFRRTLDAAAILAMRPNILAALWSLVKNWHEKGCPKPSRSHSAFPAWANIVGGIVEAAGFACPLATANVTATADPDAEDMRRLTTAMAKSQTAHTFAEVVNLAQSLGLFEALLGSPQDQLGRKEKSAFGRFLGRYDNRVVQNVRLAVTGNGHGRRYSATALHGCTVEHGVSAGTSSLTRTKLGPEDHAAPCDDAQPAEDVEVL